MTMTPADPTDSPPADTPLALGSSAGLGLELERALWEALGCVADDEECLRMLSAHIAERVAAERERCAKICEDNAPTAPSYFEIAERLRECAAEIRMA